MPELTEAHVEECRQLVRRMLRRWHYRLRWLEEEDLVQEAALALLQGRNPESAVRVAVRPQQKGWRVVPDYDHPTIWGKGMTTENHGPDAIDARDFLEVRLSPGHLRLGLGYYGLEKTQAELCRELDWTWQRLTDRLELLHQVAARLRCQP